MNRFVPRLLVAMLLLVPAGVLAASKDADTATRTGPHQLRPQDIDVRFLQLSPANPSVLQGTSLSIRLLLELPRRAPIDLTQYVTRWTSSNPALATVDRRGQVTGLKQGAVKITADLGFFQAKTPLNVVVVSAVSFTAQPSTTPVSAVITPGVSVQVLDNLAQPVPGLPVTMSIGTNAADGGGVLPNPQGVLSGTLTETTNTKGIAAFGDLKLDWLGAGYTVLATVGTPTGSISSASAAFNETRVGDPCLGPVPACSSGCPDADGDGLNDAWEIAGGIDYNGDGKIDAQHDLLLPAADPNKPDIYVQYDWMDYGGADYTCSVDADCSAYGTAHSGETCTGPPALPGTAHSCVFACTADAQCTSRGAGHFGERCVGNTCLHTHDPEVLQPGAIQAVVDSFAAHGFNLHILRGRALPHSHVLSFRLLDDPQQPSNVISDWCEGGGVASGSAGRGLYAESLYDLKSVGFDARRKPAYHYSIFGHYNTCDMDAHCQACPVPLNPNGTPKNDPPPFGASGLAEIDGNDFMVTLGNAFNDKNAAPTRGIQGGTFMHELGHNLGLRHGGGSDLNADAEDTPTFKPNYLSVMNYKFQFPGIFRGDAIGSTTRQSCSTDADCMTGEQCDPARLVCGGRLDYSTQTLPTGGNSPGALNENNPPGMNEPAGLGSGTADITSFDDGACGFDFHPTHGPLDYDGDGSTTGTNVSADLNRQDHPLVTICPSGVTEVLNGHTDWGPAPGQSVFTYKFQCTPEYGAGLDGYGAPPPACLSQNELTHEMASRAHALYPPRTAQIVILPGCLETRKPIAPGQPGTLSVALLGSDDLDVTEIEPSSLNFHGAKAVRASIRDVNGDGKPDLVAEFDMSAVHLHPSATKGRLRGWLKNSQAFAGEENIRVVPSLATEDPAFRQDGPQKDPEVP